MEIDLPDVVAEVRAAFARYEKALVSQRRGDARRAVPQGRAHHPLRRRREPLRPRGDRRLPRRALARRPRAHALAHRHHHLRPRLRRRLHAVPPRDAARQGRPADADLGALARRLAVVAAHVSVIDAPERPETDGPDATRHPHRHPRAARRLRARARPRDGRRAVFDAIEKAADPGIFISLADRKAVRRRRRSSGASIRRPSRCGACRSRSRTTSTSPACRPRRPAPPSPTRPRRARPRSSGCWPPARSLDRQDQPRPVRDRPRRRALALSGAAGTPSIPTIVPGGSSSGSAVAVARGLVPFALGTDTAGSGRVPAGLNNIVGLKPTVGAVSTRGVVPACRTLDCVSVFALTVDDAWAVYAVDRRLRRGRSVLAADRARAPGAVPPRLRIGIPRPADQSSSATRAAKSRLAGQPARCWRTSAPSRRDRHGAVQRGGRAALRGAVGGRALRRASRRSSPSTRARCIP